MSKSSTGIKGIIEDWVVRREHDAFKVAVTIPKQKWISAAVQPTLKQINEYLRVNKLRQADAVNHNDFQSLRHRLFSELRNEKGLKIYKIRERLDLKTKQFNFDNSVEQFATYKSNTSVSNKHRSTMLTFWLPFFLEKGCKHPSDFIMWRKQATVHVKTAKKLNSEERYSPHSWTNLTTTLNEYMKFLKENDDISDDRCFILHVGVTRDDKKRGRTSKSRKQDTYTEGQLLEIKSKIDSTYENNLGMKVRAYAMYFGLCTGLRRGNLLGLTAENLHPDKVVPSFETKDNIVAGWSRGEKGSITLENSTKTFYGTIELPLRQPSVSIICEVARFLKQNLEPQERLLKCCPDTVGKWWKQIADECGFKFLTPHDWKHSYATIGALHIHDWYKGNPHLLKSCCLHEKYETTLKYINQVSNEFLNSFKD